MTPNSQLQDTCAYLQEKNEPQVLIETFQKQNIERKISFQGQLNWLAIWPSGIIYKTWDWDRF